MSVIHRKIKQWAEAGLITALQQQAILQFENQQTRNTSWWLYSIMILGVSVIGLGIISLIAANWANLADSFKLGVDFALLGSLAIAIFYLQSKPEQHLWFEVLIAAFMLLCLASIGLIAQIFHTGGQWYHALLFWAVITGLLSSFASSLFTRFLWVSLLLQACVWSLNHWQSYTHHTLDAFPAVILCAPLFSAMLYYATVRWTTLQHYQSSVMFWFQLSAMVALIFADIVRSGGEMNDYHSQWYLPAYGIALLLGAGIVLNPAYRWLNRGLLLAALALLLLYYAPDLCFTGQSRYSFLGSTTYESVSLWQADDIRAPIFTLAILFLYAIHAGNSNNQRAFNLATFLIGLRFVILYFQAMGGLAATGIGLIVSGVLIMSVTWIWYKGRERIRQWTQELPA